MPDERQPHPPMRDQRLPQPGRRNLLDREEVILSDLLNRVLDRGVVITGSVLISVADVDLVRLDLGLMLTSVETGRQLDARAAAAAAVPAPSTPDHRDAGRHESERP